MPAVRHTVAPVIYLLKCYRSVVRSCSTLCNPMDCSTPGFSVLHFSWSLLKFMSIELVIPSNRLILCHSLLLFPSIFPSIRVFSRPEGPGSIPGWGTKIPQAVVCPKRKGKKDCGNPAVSKSASTIFFPQQHCSFHVSGSHFGNFHNISKIFINFIFAAVICDQGFLHPLLYLYGGGAP